MVFHDETRDVFAGFQRRGFSSLERLRGNPVLPAQIAGREGRPFAL